MKLRVKAIAGQETDRGKIVQGTINAGKHCGGGLKEVSLKILKNHPRIQLPRYESKNASGMDLCAFLETDVKIPPLGRIKIPTGLRVEIPSGFEGQIRPRSGLAIKSGLTVLNSPGTIDSDYRGEIEIIMINLGDTELVIKDGQRIAQLVIASVCHSIIEEVSALNESERGAGGFGSTGV